MAALRHLSPLVMALRRSRRQYGLVVGAIGAISRHV